MEESRAVRRYQGHSVWGDGAVWQETAAAQMETARISQGAWGSLESQRKQLAFWTVRARDQDADVMSPLAHGWRGTRRIILTMRATAKPDHRAKCCPHITLLQVLRTSIKEEINISL